MSNILKSRLGRAAALFAIAGLALFTAGASAQARDGHWAGGHWSGGHWAGHYYGPHYAWHGAPYYGGWYAPYYAPPVVYPPAYGYYGPPSLNFGIQVPL